MLSNASMLPLGALMVALAGPIVALVYERGAFNAGAASLVAALSCRTRQPRNSQRCRRAHGR